MRKGRPRRNRPYSAPVKRAYSAGADTSGESWWSASFHSPPSQIQTAVTRRGRPLDGRTSYREGLSRPGRLPSSKSNDGLGSCMIPRQGIVPLTLAYSTLFGSSRTRRLYGNVPAAFGGPGGEGIRRGGRYRGHPTTLGGEVALSDAQPHTGPYSHLRPSLISSIQMAKIIPKPSSTTPPARRPTVGHTSDFRTSASTTSDMGAIAVVSPSVSANTLSRATRTAPNSTR